jgi:ribose transport system substrate-binding protein
MKKRVTTALTVMMVAGWLAGCGGEQKSAPAATPAPAGPAGLKIAMIAKSATNPVFVSARKGADVAAKELSQKHSIPIEVVWMTPSDEDGQVQAQKIAQAVKDGVSAILISCSDAGKVTGAIDDAVAHGVPVMTFDSDAAGSKRFAFYGVDDEKTREKLMRELAKQIR